MTEPSVDRIYRIRYRGAPRYVVEQEGTWRLVTGDIFSAYHVREEVSRDGAEVLAPVDPSKIVCVGLNYREHAAEVGKPLPLTPLIFIKPSTTVVGPGQPILIPPGIGRVDHEAELAVVIGRRASRVRVDRADAYVLGYTCMNDVTARALQRQGVGYTHAKGYDTFAPIGPCIAVGVDPTDLAVEGAVNGVRRQGSRTSDLVFGVRDLVAFISTIMTLLPGDIIATGTPPGIGSLEPGDTVSVTVERIGTLSNPVRALPSDEAGA